MRHFTPFFSLKLCCTAPLGSRANTSPFSLPTHAVLSSTKTPNAMLFVLKRHMSGAFCGFLGAGGGAGFLTTGIAFFFVAFFFVAFFFVAFFAAFFFAAMTSPVSVGAGVIRRIATTRLL